MPRRPTRFDIVISQLMKEAEDGDVGEPPLSGYQVGGKFYSVNGLAKSRSIAAAYKNAPPAIRYGALQRRTKKTL